MKEDIKKWINLTPAQIKAWHTLCIKEKPQLLAPLPTNLPKLLAKTEHTEGELLLLKKAIKMIKYLEGKRYFVRNDFNKMKPILYTLRCFGRNPAGHKFELKIDNTLTEISEEIKNSRRTADRISRRLKDVRRKVIQQPEQ